MQIVGVSFLCGAFLAILPLASCFVATFSTLQHGRLQK